MTTVFLSFKVEFVIRSAIACFFAVLLLNDVNLAKLPYINAQNRRKGSEQMGRLIKWLIYLLILAVILLITYAYVGPILGVDFSARVTMNNLPVSLQIK